MNRIQIVGPSGSGKTSLGASLSKKLDIMHVELDSLFWLPEWKEKPTELFRDEVKKIISKNEWIICGDYIDRLQGLTLSRADTVIWLNYPPRVFVPRLVIRTLRRYFTRDKLWGENKESLFNFIFIPKKSLLYITLKLYSKDKRRHETKIKKYNYSGAIIEISSPRKLKKWLKTI